MKILSQSEVIERLGIPRQTFEQGIRPLMEKLGDARNLGGGRRASWAYSGENMWQWELYIATRKNLIEAGEWSAKRPYSTRDLEDIVLIGMYEEYMPKDE